MITIILSKKKTFKKIAFLSLLIFTSYCSHAQFDTIPTNKGPKATYTSWSYSAGVIDLTDNLSDHSVGAAYRLRGASKDTIFSPSAIVVSSGNVVGTAKWKFVNYLESSSVGNVSLGVFVDGGSGHGGQTYTGFATTSIGKTTWDSTKFNGNFISGTHTYQAFYTNASANSITIDDLNFGFIGASSVSIITPITLGTFYAAVRNNQVFLNWGTATESNNKGFYVERSNDGGTSYNSIDFEPTKADGGNYNGNLSYSYADASPLNGDNYYRLKQVDIDGTITYSFVVVATANVGATIKIYPNPASSYLTINGAETGATIKIINIGGQVVISTIVSSTNLDVSRLLPGIYLLQIQTNGKFQTIKFTKN